MILYANVRCPESQPRDPAGTRDLPRTLRAAFPPLDQPGERGALPDGSVDGPATEELRHHRRRGGGDLDQTLATSVDRAAWEPQALDRQRVQTLVAQSPPQGLLVLDDTGLPKQGRGSVGVARQYSGTLGKVANCQVVVSAHYVADEPTSPTPIHWPLTAQLDLPEARATDEARRATVHVPTEVAFQTKPEVALALIDQARAWGMPFAWVVADAGYGDNPTFLQGLEDRQLAYIVGVSSSFGVRLHEQCRPPRSSPAAATRAGPAQEAAPSIPV